jgi:hypothetical protein
LECFVAVGDKNIIDDFFERINLLGRRQNRVRRFLAAKKSG